MIKSIVTLAFLGFNNILSFPNESDTSRPLAVVYPNSEIEISHQQNKAVINISEGDQLVFSIDHVSIGDIYFQVPEYRRFFRYTNSSMKNVNLVIVKNNQIIIPETGEISGFKLADGIWKIDINLENHEDVSHRFYQQEEVTTAHK